MKRTVFLSVLVGLLAILALVSVVSAQGPAPSTPTAPGQGYGRGGGMGVMHEYMEAAIAEKLGLTVDELEERHAKGETFWEIAEDKGYTADEARQLMLDARSVALDQMVEEGVITQEQANWMKERSGRMMGGGGMGPGFGGCTGGGMMSPRGGRGRWSQDG